MSTSSGIVLNGPLHHCLNYPQISTVFRCFPTITKPPILGYLPSSVKQWKYHHLTGKNPKARIEIFSSWRCSKSWGPPQSSSIFGFSSINQPFLRFDVRISPISTSYWGTPHLWKPPYPKDRRCSPTWIHWSPGSPGPHHAAARCAQEPQRTQGAQHPESWRQWIRVIHSGDFCMISWVWTCGMPQKKEKLQLVVGNDQPLDFWRYPISADFTRGRCGFHP